MTTPVFDLSGKTALVTGASRGIGRAIALALAAAGAQVAITSRKPAGLFETADEIQASGGRALAINAHNGNREQIASLVDQIVSQFGTIDILVNNAATNPHFGPLLEAEDSMWAKTIEVNVMGNVWLCQRIVPLMRASGGGKVINVASVNGLRPGRWQGVYSATKAAVINLTQTLAVELAPDNIQVNAIAPGLVETKFASAIWENDVLRDAVVGRTPANRIGQPEDIAGIAVYLASQASAFTTGQTFIVDGGLSVPML